MATIISADLSSEKHAQAILLLLEEYTKDIMGGGSELSAYAKSHLIDKLRKRQDCRVVLAYINDSPAGLAICFEGFSTFACQPILNIHDLLVSPSFRGQGLAKLLLSRVEEVAVETGCCKMTLEVLEGNQLAQHIYRKFGFDNYELDPEMGRAMFYEKKLGTA